MASMQDIQSMIRFLEQSGVQPLMTARQQQMDPGGAGVVLARLLTVQNHPEMFDPSQIDSVATMFQSSQPSLYSQWQQTQAPISTTPIPPPSSNPPSVSSTTPPLPTIPGLSNPPVPPTPATPSTTPVNVATVPGTDISPYIPTTSQQQQDVVNQAIAQSQGIAGQQFQNLQQTIGPYLQNLTAQGVGAAGAIGGGNLQNLEQSVNPYIQNMTQQGIQAAGDIGQRNLQNVQQTVAPYLQNLTNQGVQQSQGTATQDFQQLQSLLDPYVKQQMDYWTNPTSPGYQQLAGNLNNTGNFNSGAFDQAVASRLAPLISQNQLTLGQDTLVPSFQNQQNLISGGVGAEQGAVSSAINPSYSNQQNILSGGLSAQAGLLPLALNPSYSSEQNILQGGLAAESGVIPSIFNPSYSNQQNLASQGAGVQSNLGLDSLQRFIEQQNWQKQSDLANQLAAQGASSSFGSGIGGLLGGGLGAGLGAALAPTGYGLAGAGIGAMVGSKGGSGIGGGTWICTHLKNLGLATPEEVEKVHKSLIVTLLTHPIDWIQYFIQAPMLISLLDQQDFDWSSVKSLFIDDILIEEDAEIAFQKYQSACWSLYSLVCGGETWSWE